MRASTLRGFGTALALVVAASVASADSDRKIDEDHPGYRDYRQYCAACHGVFANGEGPVAVALKTPPADLTRLGERYGMPLPRAKLIPFIDGRDAKRAHGTREMPIWGKILMEDQRGGTEREMMVRGTIIVILDYIESVQVEAPENGS